jgi:ABC-2 type transport system permease protein
MMPAADAAPGVAAPEATAPATVPRPFYWSLRRELWESRSLYLAPLAVAAVFLVGYLIGLGGLPGRVRAALALGPAQRHAALMQPFDLAALAIMAATFIVGVLYCLEALHVERRDRSIVFWKSLPVSDRTTVLAKASVAVVGVPLLSFVVTVATQGLMLCAGSAVLAASGLGGSTLWADVQPVAMTGTLIAHLVVVHMLWYAPIYGWLLLASAWSRRVPLLWAALPPLALCLVERLAFGTSHLARLIGHRLAGGPEAVASSARSGMPDAMMDVDPAAFLTSPGLWVGLVVTLLCLAAATRLRRLRD